MSVADEIRSVPIARIWKIAGAVVGLFGGIAAAIGQGEAGDSISSVAGYTLPLTAGFAVIAFALISGLCEKVPPVVQFGGAAGILWAAGVAAGTLGYRGMAFDHIAISGGPQRFLGSVLEVYLNAYGFPLMICALAIGVASAIHAERYLASQGQGAS